MTWRRAYTILTRYYDFKPWDINRLTIRQFKIYLDSIPDLERMFPRSGGMGSVHKKAGQMMTPDELNAKIRAMTGMEI